MSILWIQQNLVALLVLLAFIFGFYKFLVWFSNRGHEEFSQIKKSIKKEDTQLNQTNIKQ